MRPIGSWLISMIRSRRSAPRKVRNLAPGQGLRSSAAATAGSRVSLTSEDLPDPDTPVTQVISPSGNLTSRSLRLLALAPSMISVRSGCGGRRIAGTGMLRKPLKYCPVSEAGSRLIASGGPCATTWPPCAPAPGPRSTT